MAQPFPFLYPLVLLISHQTLSDKSALLLRFFSYFHSQGSLFLPRSGPPFYETLRAKCQQVM